MRTIHNVFTKGELNPDLFARVDVTNVYTHGARRMRNLIGLWTGAATIAPGARYVDVLVDRTNANAPIKDYTQVKGLDFQYDSENDIVYTLIFRPDTASTVAIDVYYENTLQASVAASMYTVAQIKDLNFAVGQDRVLILHEDVPIQQLKRGATHTSWTLSAFVISTYPVFDYTVLGGTQYRVPGFTFTPGATSGAVTLTASSSIFTSNHVGGIFIGNGGIARITSVTNGANATIATTTDFLSTAPINGVDASLSEVMWTSGGGPVAGENRGWPARGVFYLNRLVLGRSKELKNLVAFSMAGVFDDFNDEVADDLASFSASFNGKGNQSVQSIVAEDSIIFLTSNKVFAQNPLIESGISASSFYFAPQVQDPASSIPAASIDNQVIHISGNQSQVISVAYSTADAKYVSLPIGLYSSQLFTTLNSNGIWEPKNINARLYMATQTDGSMVMLNSLSNQEVMAWSLRNTPGLFRQVIGEGTQASVIVEREINTGGSYFNTLDSVYLTDNLFTAFDDVTTSFSDNTNNVTMFTDQNDYVLIGNQTPFNGLQVTLATPASANLNLTFEYLDGYGNWNFFTPTDSTSGMSASGNITWGFNNTPNWSRFNLFNPYQVSEGSYWIRIRRTIGSVTTLPIESLVLINTDTRLYLEQMSFDLYTDCTTATSSDADGNVTGLTNLAGHQIYAISNGVTNGPYFVDASGNVNIESEFDNVNIGIQYRPELVPMPLFTPTQEGLNSYERKYVQDLYIDYVDSLYLQAGSIESQAPLTEVPSIPLGDYTLGTPVLPQTGVFLIHPRGEWDARQQTLITQLIPGPMTIIGIGYNVEVT